MERFSPVRRGSEGSNSGTRTLSPSTPQQECQRLQRGLQPRASPPRSIPGSPIHQQYQKSAAAVGEPGGGGSPIHQFYQTDPSIMKDVVALEGYDPNRSPLHTSPYASTSGNLGSPVHHQGVMFGLYSGAAAAAGGPGAGGSPVLNPLLSPNASPVFGGFPGQSSVPTSISSITQGKWTRPTVQCRKVG